MSRVEENEDEEAMEENLAQQVQDLVELVRTIIHLDQAQSSQVSIKRTISNPTLNESKRSSFKRKR